RVAQEVRHFVETVFLPRHNQQPQPREFTLQLAENVQNHAFFRVLRAAGDPNLVRRIDSEQPPQLLRARVAAVALHAVVFDRAGDVQAIRGHAEAAETSGKLPGLHAPKRDASKDL